MSNAGESFDPDCTRCSRLATFLADVQVKHPDYFARPVPSFGEQDARLLIVGLAPGMHGANATGRPFTGDHAGILLYQTLYDFGFASRPASVAADDGLELTGCRITNAVRCLPPENKPTTSEVNTCNTFLAHELASLPRPGIVLALGTIAHRAVLRALGLRLSAYRFGHAARHDIGPELTLIDSYHCSRYNTQTRRLTTPMFQDVFRSLRAELDAIAA
jgi:uracil-DNA glycosylase family 4